MRTRNAKRYRLAIVATHPIQYHVPVYRALSVDPEIDLHVFFASDHSLKGIEDDGFRVNVAWDVPLLDGYSCQFMRAEPPLLRPRQVFRYYRPGLAAKLLRGRFDAVLVHSYGDILFWQALRAARKLRIPLLMRPTAYDGCRTRRPLYAGLRRSILAFVYRRIGAFLAVGMRAEEHFLKNGGSPSKLFPARYCVDNARFERARDSLPEARQLRRQLGLEQCSLVALYCGKLIPVKAPLLLARALGLTKHRNDLGLLVVGDGVLRSEVESAVSRAGIRAYAFLGFQNQASIHRCYGASDFIVLPSWGETWGAVVNEAMLFGLPAIVSDRVGCAPDLVSEGKTGYTFPADDPQALADRLDRMCESPGHVRCMGRNALARVREYTPENAAAGIRGAFVPLAGRGRARVRRPRSFAKS